MIPAFLVPLSLLLHLASLQKLRQVEREAGDLTSPLAERKHGSKIESAKNDAGERTYKIAK
jgi:hypothetical protein